MRKYSIITTVPIVTLITDLGKDTHVIAKAKAKLITQVPQVTIIDITHAVSPFLIDEAVYYARSCVSDFPKNTIHLIAVDADIIKYKRVLVCRYKEQLFVTVDNGFLAMLTRGEDCEVYELDHTMLNLNAVSALKTLLVPMAIQLIENEIEAIGKKVDTILEKTVEQPIRLNNGLRGNIIYINNYNNAITNISMALFDDVSNGRRFRIEFNRFDTLSKLSESYSDVETGNSLCFFNADGFLEIAINRGSASELLGLGKGKRITIEFFDERSVSETKEVGLL